MRAAIFHGPKDIGVGDRRRLPRQEAEGLPLDVQYGGAGQELREGIRLPHEIAVPVPRLSRSAEECGTRERPLDVAPCILGRRLAPAGRIQHLLRAPLERHRGAAGVANLPEAWS